MINNTLNIGLQGVQRGMVGAEGAARKIASAGAVGAEAPVAAGSNAGSGSGGLGSLADSMVELKLYQRSVEASSSVVRTADDMLGTLLDARA